jgi:hypothetical protein
LFFEVSEITGTNGSSVLFRGKILPLGNKKKVLCEDPLGIRARNFENLLGIDDEQPSYSYPKE